MKVIISPVKKTRHLISRHIAHTNCYSYTKPLFYDKLVHLFNVYADSYFKINSSSRITSPYISIYCKIIKSYSPFIFIATWQNFNFIPSFNCIFSFFIFVLRIRKIISDELIVFELRAYLFVIGWVFFLSSSSYHASTTSRYVFPALALK